MNESYSRLRQQAEIAFGRTQSPRILREQAFNDLDAIKVARDNKTLRLREARLAREAQDSSLPMARPALIRN